MNEGTNDVFLTWLSFGLVSSHSPPLLEYEQAFELSV